MLTAVWCFAETRQTISLHNFEFIIYKIPIMYCNTHANSYHAIGSVIPCKNDTNINVFFQLWQQRTQLEGTLWMGATLSVSRNWNFPNKGVRLLHSLVRCRLKWSDFRVKLKDCFVYACRHGTWKSLGRTSTWVIFPWSVVRLLGGIWLAYHYYGATTCSKQFRWYEWGKCENGEKCHQALDYWAVSLAAGWHCESIQHSVYKTMNGLPISPLT